jgi:hypothetical protein
MREVTAADRTVMLMDRLSFHVEDDANIGPCIEPVIDGERLSVILGTGTVGMWPKGLATALLPRSGEPRRTQVQRCGCGDTGCDYVTVEIAATEAEVVWSDFVARSSNATMPNELRFERAAYVRALDTLPAEAVDDASAQPTFVPPGPPYHYFMIAAPGSTRHTGVFARFRADDIAEAREQARVVAAEKGIAEQEYLVMQVGTKHLDAATVEGITRPASGPRGVSVER